MSATIYTKDQVMKKISKLVVEHGSQSALAEAVGCDRTEVNAILAGRREPSAKVLEALGIERVKLYVSNLNEKFRE